MAGDLKLTVDIAALLQAQSIVKKMDGQTINLKFRTTGLNDINSIKKSLSGISGASKTSAQDVNRVAASFDNLGNAIKKSNTVNSDGSTKNVAKYNAELGKTITLTEKVSAAKKKTTSTTVSQVDAEKLELKQLGQKEAKLRDLERLESRSGKYVNASDANNVRGMLNALDPKSTDYAKQYEKANQAYTKVKSSAQDAAYAQNQLTQANKKNLLSVDNIKESMGTAAIRTVEWAATMGVLYGAVNAVRSMVSTSTAISDQMNRIQMVTGASSGETQQLLVNYQNIATELSSTTSAVAASAEVWLRQGRSIADTNALIETSTVLSKVGFMDSATSAQMLTSAINGYGIAAEDAMSVVDKMSAIDVNAATSTEDLALAMAQTASGAKIAGVSMDELLSYIATISDVTQASGDTIGVSLKTMFARINSVKLGSLTDSEGEDISRVETALKEYGITLRKTDGTAKDTGNILDELSVKWKTLTGLQKSEIAMQMAGVHQKEKFLVLMENYNKALKYQDIAANSAGSAMEKMSIWEESTEAATQRLTNQWEIMSTKMVDSNFTKAIINLGTFSLAALTTDAGQLAIKMAMVAAAVAAVVAVGGKIGAAWGAVDIIGGSGMLVGLKKVSEAQKAFKALDTVADTTGDTLRTVGNITEGVGDAVEGIGDVTSKFGKDTFSSKVATNGLKSALGEVAAVAIPVAGALALVVGGLWAADRATESYSEKIEGISSLKTKLSDDTAAISETEGQLNSVKDRIKEIEGLKAPTIADKTELANLEAVNQQLQIKIDSLKQINDVTTEKISDESIAAVGMDNKYSAVKKTYSGVIQTPEKITTPEYIEEQMQMIEAVERAQEKLEANRSKLTSSEYVEAYDKLSEKQKEYSLNANNAMVELTDLAAGMDSTTTEGQEQIKMITDLSKALTENNKLVGIASENQSSGEVASTFGEAQAGDPVEFAGYLQKLSLGLESGVTDSDAFYTSMEKIFGFTPPDDIAASLGVINSLFSLAEGSEQGVIDTMAKWKVNGVYDLKAMQAELGLTDTAMATVSARLFEMGEVLPGALGSSALDTIRTLGNGLDIAADQSVNLESKLLSIYDQIGKNGFSEEDAKASGEAFIQSWVDSNILTPEDGERIIQSYRDTIDAFSRESTKITEQLQTQWGDEFQNSLDEQFSRNSEMKVANVYIGGMFDTTQFEADLTAKLQATGEYTDEQIQQIVGQERHEQLIVRIDALVETTLPPDLGAETQQQIMDIINQNTNTDTGEINVGAVNVALDQANISGIEGIRDQLTSDLNTINGKMTVEVQLEKTQAEAAAKQLEEDGKKKVNVSADTSAYDSAISSILGAHISKTVDIITNETTNTTNYVSTVNPNTGMEVKSATGRINVDTSQIGTQSLIGEEGEETLLRNGKVSFIGTNGAEIIPIRDGDTILPADITKRIKSGQIPMYASGKYNVSVSNSPASTDWYADQRANSSIWAGLAGDAPEDDEAKKAYEAHIKSFQKEYDYYKHLLDMGEMNEKDYYAKVNSLNDQYFKGKNEYLDEYRDHEKEVHDFLKQQEEERLKTLEENYSSSSSYILDLLDNQIDSLKEQEALAEKQEDLDEKQEKLDNLKGNKNQRVYHEGQGWIWEEDKTAIAEVEKDIADTKKDMVDDSASAKLQEYRDKWAEIQDNYENEQSKLEAIALLGDDFEKKILDGDLDILRDFATKYSTVLGSISNNEGDTSVPLLDYAKAWETDEIKRLMEDESTGGILTAALNNNLSGLTTSAISSAQSSSSSSIVFSGDINLENVTDFNSFITEAKQYARVNSPK